MSGTEAKTNDCSRQIHKAICEECVWTYVGKADEDGAFAKARAMGHAYEHGHRLQLKTDILDLRTERIVPRLDR